MYDLDNGLNIFACKFDSIIYNCNVKGERQHDNYRLKWWSLCNLLYNNSLSDARGLY